MKKLSCLSDSLVKWSFSSLWERKTTNLIYYNDKQFIFFKFQLVIFWKSQLFWTRLDTFNTYKCLFGPRVKAINAFWNEVSLQTGKYVFNSRRVLLLWIAYFLSYSWMRRVRCANARWELSQMRRLWLPLVRSQMRQLFWDNAICLLCCWFNEAPRSASALSNWTLEAGDARAANSQTCGAQPFRFCVTTKKCNSPLRRRKQLHRQSTTLTLMYFSLLCVYVRRPFSGYLLAGAGGTDAANNYVCVPFGSQWSSCFC
jgi:hypothetical protein